MPIYDVNGQIISGGGDLSQIGNIPFSVAKGYWGTDGKIKPNTTALCTSALFQSFPGARISVVIRDPNFVYSVMQGDTPDALAFTARLAKYSEFGITGKYWGMMFYKSDGAGGYTNLTVADWEQQVSVYQNYAAGYSTHDTPENSGVQNVINRAYQMAKLTYRPVANLPTQIKTSAYPNYVPKGSLVKGVMYSSVRDESLYVPQCVNFNAYMTALLNPKSYIYTRTEPAPHYNALTYNGAVCSSMVAWCYGIDNVVPTTVSFATYPGMEIIDNQSPDGLKLGDMLNKSNSHIAIITDITRTDGVITGIEITEQTNISSHPMTRSVTFTPAEIQSNYFGRGYIALRYSYIADVPYTPTPWVNLGSETAEPVVNANLSPRRGDTANWRPGETVEIDVTDRGNYTSVKLYKNNALEITTSLPDDDIIQYSGLAYGSYKVCLTDGTNDSDFVYFNIIGTSVSYTPLGNGQVKATFSSANATPASICFCDSLESDSDYRATRGFHVLTDAEVQAGEVTVTAPETDSRSSWLMKMMFKSEFGLYSSELTLVNMI